MTSRRRMMMLQALTVQGINFDGNKCTGRSIYGFTFDWAGNTLRSTARSSFVGATLSTNIFLRGSRADESIASSTSTNMGTFWSDPFAWADPLKRYLITATVAKINSITGSNPNTSISLVATAPPAEMGQSANILDLQKGSRLSLIFSGGRRLIGLCAQNPGTAWDIEFDIAIKEVE